MTTIDAQAISFLAPLPPLPLRRNRETSHKGYRAALVRQYQEDVWCAGDEARPWTSIDPLLAPRLLKDVSVRMRVEREPWEKARLTLTWRHHRVVPDADNALASLKPLIDVLKATGPRPLGIFRDDSPDCLTVAIRVEKVRTKAQEGVLVEVVRG